MGRGSRGRGRGSVGDHPEDEEDFYEEEMEVSSPPALGGGGGAGGRWWGRPVRLWRKGECFVAALCVSAFISYFGIEETFIQFQIEKVPKL